MGIDLFAPGSASALVLCALRVGGLLLVAPMFSSRTISAPLKAALLAVLSWLLVPAAVAAAPAPPLTLAAAFAETLIGFAVGLGAAVFVGAAEAAGELLAIQIGLSGAASLDPLSHASVPVLGQFMNLFTLTLLLAVNGHLLMLEAVGASFRLLPLGSPVDVQAGTAAMVATGSELFVLGLRFAAPVTAAVLLANVAIAILGRAAPQLNVLAVVFPLQIGIGLLAFAGSIPLIAAFFTGWSTVYEELVMGFFGALAGGR